MNSAGDAVKGRCRTRGLSGETLGGMIGRERERTALSEDSGAVWPGARFQ